MTRRSRWVFAALEAVLLAAVPVLGWIGFRTVLHTTAGQAVDPELDPEEPGYEAFVDSTPVALFIGTDADGALSWLAVDVLGGPGEHGGAVIVVPPATVVEVEHQETTLAALFAEDGRPVLAQAVADLLGVGFDDVAVVDGAHLAELLAPVSPLPVTLADPVPGFETGEQQLEAARVVELLGARGASESDLARMARQEDVWRAWLAAVGASTDPDVVPGERTAGIGRYVRGLAAGTVTVDLLPVDPVTDPTTGEERFTPDDEAIDSLIVQRVPFPVGSHPGARAHVRILDGVGADGLALRAAREAVRGGAQIVVVGNADRFGIETSSVSYFDGGFADDAAAIGEALGIDDVHHEEGPNPNDLVDVTVVVGNDLASAYGLTARTGGANPG